MQYSLVVTGSFVIPRQVQNDLIIERADLSTTHEEVNIILVQQAYHFILDVCFKSVCLICSNTDVFVLLHIIIRNCTMTSRA